MCHGDAGRGDGPTATALNFEWGHPYAARDFTRGWTFKGGHELRDIYLRITGGLDGTPMGPYLDLLTDQERWDLAHYVASLDREPSASGEDFLITAALIKGQLPSGHEAPEWERSRSILIPLAGQVVQDPPLRWWIPTVASVNVRALWNGEEVAFLLEWNDPTGPADPLLDSAFLQFPAEAGSKPYFLSGDADNPVNVWCWRSRGKAEQWRAAGTTKKAIRAADSQGSASWLEGRWHLVFRRPLADAPKFQPGTFVPTLLAIRDGANGESDEVNALSTWVYTTLERPPSRRPWLLALAWGLAVVIIELLILSRLKS
jgi:DMSO reductase family type II enzyme heme b subunit